MKILIGYDGSDCAGAALDDLQRSGLPPATEALVISVAEQWLPPPPPSSYEIVEESFAEATVGGVIKATAQASQAVEDAHARAFKPASCANRSFQTGRC
jgi:hypothetical protein